MSRDGISRSAVFETLEAYRQDDTPWRERRTWAYVYDPGPEAESDIEEAFASHLGENSLDPTAFPSALRVENEVVPMAASHLNGDENVVGSFSSGSTQSLICAVKVGRDRRRPSRNRTQPQLRRAALPLRTIVRPHHSTGSTRSSSSAPNRMAITFASRSPGLSIMTCLAPAGSNQCCPLEYDFGAASVPNWDLIVPSST